MKDRAIAEAVASGRMPGANATARAADQAIHANGHMVTQDERAGLLENARSARK